jgi:hypothetical protein
MTRPCRQRRVLHPLQASSRLPLLLLLPLSCLFLHPVSVNALIQPYTSYRFAPNGVCVSPRTFVDVETGQAFTMRAVPGEGDCMFLAVALAALTSMGLGANTALLKAISREQRNVVASILESDGGNLIIEGQRQVTTTALLKSAAAGEGLTTDQYLSLLRKEGVDGGLYGGGPELTVLANVLRRPISIYEVAATANDDDKSDLTNSHSVTTTNANGFSLSDICHIDCKGVFGKGAFEDPLVRVHQSAILSPNLQREFQGAYSWQIHVLVVDTSPLEKHACVLLPIGTTAQQ